MKRRLFTLIAASVLALSSYAQIGSSTSRTIQTHVVQTQYEISYARRYNRIYVGSGIGMASVSGEYEKKSFSTPTLVGPSRCELGWTIGFPISKATDLFFETGLDLYFRAMECPWEDISFSSDVTVFEIPLNLTYRFDINNKKFISPYAGLSVGFYAWNGMYFYDTHDRGGGRWDNDASSLLAVLQLGVNFDLKHLHLGLGWYKNVTNPLWDGTHNVQGYGSDPKMKYSDVRLRIGYIFNRKIRKRIL